MKNHITFLKHFLRNPTAVGAVSALNDNVAKKMVKYLKSRDYSRPCRILEVGAGTGSITKKIVPELSDNDILDLVEIDLGCCKILEEKFNEHKGVQVISRSVLDWKPEYQYDFIISTLPFNSFPAPFVESILAHFKDISASGCLCSYVEYAFLSKISQLFGNKMKKPQIRSRRQTLKNYRNTLLIEKQCELRNFPPCHIYHMNMGRPSIVKEAK
ncbi:MAG: phospholipid N-methyltransferase [Chlamydiales bacterium]|jgi:phospholipid N-methyltransferase